MGAADTKAIWRYQDGSKWKEFDAMASKEIDANLRAGYKNTSKTRIDFPLTKGPFFSKPKNKGTYWIVATVNTNRTKIISINQRNSATNTLRKIKRTPPFEIPASPKKAVLFVI